MKGIETLSYILQKLDFDARYLDKSLRERVVGIYFPLIPLVVDNLAVITKAGNYEKRNWLICFLFIVKGRKMLFKLNSNVILRNEQ